MPQHRLLLSDGVSNLLISNGTDVLLLSTSDPLTGVADPYPAAIGYREQAAVSFREQSTLTYRES